ncbi:MAG TPA: hypothetical protein PK245_00550, partial [Clostridia bacterium]|nr:hypothetical protein [Clostridia bacterium]
RNHGAEKIKCPFATWGRTEGNPVWENIREGCRLAGMNFLVNVAMNAEGKISAVFSGEWEAAYRKGTDFVKRHAMKKADKLYDIVIASNSGYPLDINLYQCVKAMSCAAEIVKEGGTIIIAGECLDGIPSGSHYQKVLASASSPAELFELISSGKLHAPEQWQAQIQARVQKRAKVYVYSDGLSDDEIRSAMLTPCRDIAALVKKLGGSVAVLPKGPQTIAYFEKEN